MRRLFLKDGSHGIIQGVFIQGVFQKTLKKKVGRHGSQGRWCFFMFSYLPTIQFLQGIKNLHHHPLINPLNAIYFLLGNRWHEGGVRAPLDSQDSRWNISKFWCFPLRLSEKRHRSELLLWKVWQRKRCSGVSSYTPWILQLKSPLKN